MEINEFKELSENIKELTMAVKDLTMAIKDHQNGKAKDKPKSEAEMCKVEDFVEQVYSGLYETDKIREAMKKRNILDESGALNPYHPDCIFWLVKDGIIYGDPDAINNLILDMLAED